MRRTDDTHASDALPTARAEPHHITSTHHSKSLSHSHNGRPQISTQQKPVGTQQALSIHRHRGGYSWRGAHTCASLLSEPFLSLLARFGEVNRANIDGRLIGELSPGDLRSLLRPNEDARASMPPLFDGLRADS